MPSKKRINNLTGQQARIALLYLLERTYDAQYGGILNTRLEDSLKIAESFPSKEEEAHSSTG